jgi:hypothetical protein
VLRFVNQRTPQVKTCAVVVNQVDAEDMDPGEHTAYVDEVTQLVRAGVNCTSVAVIVLPRLRRPIHFDERAPPQLRSAATKLLSLGRRAQHLLHPRRDAASSGNELYEPLLLHAEQLACALASARANMAAEKAKLDAELAQADKEARLEYLARKRQQREELDSAFTEVLRAQSQGPQVVYIYHPRKGVLDRISDLVSSLFD